MLKSKKIKALCCAMALVFAVPVFASASSNVWRHKWLPQGRGAVELTLGPHSNPNVHQAVANVTKCDPGSMWLRVFDHGTFASVTDEYHCDANHEVKMGYYTGIASGRWLQLQGGADNALYSGYTEGTCDFG